MNNIGNKLKEYRQKEKLTQKQLSEIIDIEIKRISLIERNIEEPTDVELTKINEIIGIKEESLWTKIGQSKFGPFIKFLIILLLIVGAFFLGLNLRTVDNNTKNTTTETTKVSDKLLNQIKDDISKINEELTDDKKLEDAEYYTEGNLNNYNYVQYLAVNKDSNSYAVWIIDKNTDSIISVWTSEQRKSFNESTALIMLNKFMEIYKDRINEENWNKIKTSVQKNESASFISDNLSYFQTIGDNESDVYKEVALYEIDFFKYTPEENTETNNTTQENTQTTQKYK